MIAKRRADMHGRRNRPVRGNLVISVDGPRCQRESSYGLVELRGSAGRDTSGGHCEDGRINPTKFEEYFGLLPVSYLYIPLLEMMEEKIYPARIA